MRSSNVMIMQQRCIWSTLCLFFYTQVDCSIVVGAIGVEYHDSEYNMKLYSVSPVENLSGMTYDVYCVFTMVHESMIHALFHQFAKYWSLEYDDFNVGLLECIKERSKNASLYASASILFIYIFLSIKHLEEFLFCVCVKVARCFLGGIIIVAFLIFFIVIRL